MLLSEYKKNKRYTIQDMAKKFNVPHRTMYSWLQSNVKIKGRDGSRVIYSERELAKEKSE